MFKPGDKVYVIAHAYWHFVAEVVEVLPRFVRVRNCRQVHACKRGWTAFFAEGFKRDTTYFCWPDGTWLPIGTLPVAPWNHEIPKE